MLGRISIGTTNSGTTLIRTLKESSITKLFIKAYNTKLSRKIIGELYRHIAELRGHSTDYMKAKWEKEFGTVITSEDWTTIIDTPPPLRPHKCGEISHGKKFVSDSL